MMQNQSSPLLDKINLAQLYMDIAAGLIVSIGEDEKVLSINQDGADILGYPKSEIIGENWFDKFVPEDGREYLRSAFHNILKGKTKMDYYENPVINSAGEERTINWHNMLIHDSKGNLIGTMSSGEDITERKRLEAELNRYRQRLEEGVANRTAEFSQSESKLRLVKGEREQVEQKLKIREAMLDKSPEAIFLVNKQWNFVYVNEAACRLYGYSREELLGLNLNLLIPPEEGPVIETVTRQLAENREAQIDSLHRRKDGTTMPVYVHLGQIDTQYGEFTINIVHDISQHRNSVLHKAATP